MQSTSKSTNLPRLYDNRSGTKQTVQQSAHSSVTAQENINLTRVDQVVTPVSPPNLMYGESIVPQINRRVGELKTYASLFNDNVKNRDGEINDIKIRMEQLDMEKAKLSEQYKKNQSEIEAALAEKANEFNEELKLQFQEKMVACQQQLENNLAPDNQNVLKLLSQMDADRQSHLNALAQLNNLQKVDREALDEYTKLLAVLESASPIGIPEPNVTIRGANASNVTTTAVTRLNADASVGTNENPTANVKLTTNVISQPDNIANTSAPSLPSPANPNPATLTQVGAKPTGSGANPNLADKHTVKSGWCWNYYCKSENDSNKPVTVEEKEEKTFIKEKSSINKHSDV